MTRKRSVTAGIFAMPQAITEAALSCLTPDQRAAIDAEKAADIMRITILCAQGIGSIVERQPPVLVALANKEGT